MICNSANLAELVTTTNSNSLVSVELMGRYYRVSADTLPSFLRSLEEKAAIVKRNADKLSRGPSGKGRGRGKGSGTGKSTARGALYREDSNDLRDIKYLAEQVKGTLSALSEKKSARAAEVAATAATASSPSSIAQKLTRSKALEEREFAATAAVSTTAVRKSVRGTKQTEFYTDESGLKHDMAAAWDSEFEDDFESDSDSEGKAPKKKKAKKGGKKAATKSDEENSRPTIVNSRGLVVDKAISEAATLRGKRGRQSQCIIEKKMLGELNAQLPQVCRDLSLKGFRKIEIVDIRVKEETVDTPSQRNKEKTTTRLVQVPEDDLEGKPLTCFRMTKLNGIVKQLEKKPKNASKALFNFNSAGEKKPCQLVKRLKGDLRFELVWGLETDANGYNKGWHDLNKKDYREDMVWLFGHRWLDVNDPNKVASIKHHKDNRKWSFSDL